jgi:small subunit ribosomal protein S20
MANTTSAKKMTRKIAKRTAVNRSRRSRMRTFVRKVEEAIASGDKTAAAEAFRAAQPELMRAAQKGIVHKNAASRKVSRLASRISGLNAWSVLPSRPKSPAFAGLFCGREDHGGRATPHRFRRPGTLVRAPFGLTAGRQ